MFLARYYAMSTLIAYSTELVGAAISPQFLTASPVIGITRLPTFLVGFIITEVYLWHSTIGNTRQERKF